MYWQAARADISIETVSRSPSASLLVCLQKWSIAFSSGVALGSSRTSIPNTAAPAKLPGDLCWVARSSKRTGFHPGQRSRAVRRKARWVSFVHASAICRATAPLRTLIAP
jgi:hypothetical protein